MARNVDMRHEETRPRQAAVIPVRRVIDGTVQVCLIRRTNSEKWGIPKGYIERGDDWREAAQGEAREEAGLDGRLVGEPIGTYEYRIQSSFAATSPNMPLQATSGFGDAS